MIPNRMNRALGEQRQIQQRFQLGFVLVVRHKPRQRCISRDGRMEVDFAYPVRQFSHQAVHTIRRHMAAPRQSETVIVGRDPGSMRLSPKQPRPVIQGLPAKSDARPAPRKHHGRFGRNPHMSSGRTRGRCRSSAVLRSDAGACACARWHGRASARWRRKPRTGRGFRRQAAGEHPDGRNNQPEAELVRRETGPGRPPDPELRTEAIRLALRSPRDAARREAMAFPRPSHRVQRSRTGNHQARCSSMPLRCACTIASLTDSDRPKSSAEKTTPSSSGTAGHANASPLPLRDEAGGRGGVGTGRGRGNIPDRACFGSTLPQPPPARGGGGLFFSATTRLDAHG